MSSIRNELVTLDTNEFVFAVRASADYPSCRRLLYGRIGELRVFVPREIVRELRRNLIPAELQAALAPLRRAAHVVWGFMEPPAELVSHYRSLGAKKGDAVIASHLAVAGVSVLVSENRHFLGEIRDLPFRVLTAEEALEELA